MRVAQGVHVRPVLVDPCVYPIAIRSFPLQCAENFAALALADLDIDLRPDGHVRVGRRLLFDDVQTISVRLGPGDVAEHTTCQRLTALQQPELRAAAMPSACAW